jgi:endonuclease YncB( thermonuclease family)
MAMKIQAMPGACLGKMVLALDKMGLTGIRRCFAFGSLILGCTGFPVAAQAESFKVIDSVTVSVDGAYYRLDGIKPIPEGHQCKAGMGTLRPCDQLAVDLLSKLGTGARIICEPHGDSGYGLVLAKCITANGNDIGSILVRHGLAVSGGSSDFDAEQERAKSDRLGIWRLQR